MSAFLTRPEPVGPSASPIPIGVIRNLFSEQTIDEHFQVKCEAIGKQAALEPNDTIRYRRGRWGPIFVTARHKKRETLSLFFNGVDAGLIGAVYQPVDARLPHMLRRTRAGKDAGMATR